MACRGHIALEDIQVDFQVEPVELHQSIAFGVREVVTLKGQISETERLRLQRAAQYCPVGQALTKGSIEIEDEVQWSSGEATAASPTPEGLQPLAGDLPGLPPGSVTVATSSTRRNMTKLESWSAKARLRFTRSAKILPAPATGPSSPATAPRAGYRHLSRWLKEPGRHRPPLL